MHTQFHMEVLLLWKWLEYAKNYEIFDVCQ